MITAPSDSELEFISDVLDETTSPRPNRDRVKAMLRSDAVMLELTTWKENGKRQGFSADIHHVEPSYRSRYVGIFRVVAFAGAPIEIKDVGRRRGSNVSLKKAEQRFAKEVGGWD